SIVGGDGQDSGQIHSSNNMGPVTVGGDVLGGGGQDSGFIRANGSMGDVTVGGSVLGGGGIASATIIGDGGVGQVHIGGDVQGGTGSYFGRVISKYGGLASVDIAGSLIGTTNGSGVLFGPGSFGAIRIAGDVRGGSGGGSGRVNTYGALASISIGGA